MASLALSMIMLPPIARTVEVVLRLVPDGLREASLALGASRARTVWSVVLPTARTGVTTAIVLGVARVVGETAPLLWTSFGSSFLNLNPFNGSQESLPLFVFRNVQEQSETAKQRGYAGGLMLLIVVLGLFALARFIGRDRSANRPGRRARPAAASVPPRPPVPLDPIDRPAAGGVPPVPDRSGGRDETKEMLTP
jgi:phosphate transport system permease protein